MLQLSPFLNAEQVCPTLTNRVFFIQRLRLIVEISLSISSLTYCTSTPHVCALASPCHLSLINFTNSPTVLLSNSPLFPFYCKYQQNSALNVLPQACLKVSDSIYNSIKLLQPVPLLRFFLSVINKRPIAP